MNSDKKESSSRYFEVHRVFPAPAVLVYCQLHSDSAYGNNHGLRLVTWYFVKSKRKASARL